MTNVHECNLSELGFAGYTKYNPFAAFLANTMWLHSSCLSFTSVLFSIALMFGSYGLLAPAVLSISLLFIFTLFSQDHCRPVEIKLDPHDVINDDYDKTYDQGPYI
jgi:hypothetical protein